MRSVNKVILIGNLTRDPETRQTPNGQSVTTFGLATNREWSTRDGQRHTSSEFHEVVAWSKLADICGKYLKKGKLVYIEGYLKTRSWDTPEGIKKFKTEIVIQDMIMLEKRQGGEMPDYIPDEGAQETPHLESESATATEIEQTEPLESKPRSIKKSEPKKEQPVAATVSAGANTSQVVDIDKDLGL